MGRKKIRISEHQGFLPFGSSGKRGVLSYASPMERLALSAFVACFVVSALCYMYFVMASVAHVSAREDARREASLISGSIASLEAEYLAHSHGITEAYARSLGFVKASRQAYVERLSPIALTGTRP